MITVDLHGMIVVQAKKHLEKVIKEAPIETKEIRVIHGHQHGDTIRSMVRDPNQLRSHRIVRRKYTQNQGETILVLNA